MIQMKILCFTHTYPITMKISTTKCKQIIEWKTPTTWVFRLNISNEVKKFIIQFTGLYRKFLKFIGYHPSTSSDDQNILRQHTVSNKTDGLDVRLLLLFKKYSENKLVESNKRQLQLILPGTLWCGDGNAANSDQDLGFFYKTDQCCKYHDYCPKFIESGEKFMNLENIGVFTRFKAIISTASGKIQ